MGILKSASTRNAVGLLGVIVFVLMSCARDSGKLSLRRETKAVTEWREQRLERLLRDDGWLTVTGLYWLRGGENTFGSEGRVDIVFPKDKCPGFAGLFYIERNVTAFEAVEDAGVTHNGEPVRRMRLKTDKDGDPTVLKMGTLSFYVIDRGGRRGVRLKDSESAALKEFSGLEYFPIGLKWRVAAHFVPSDSGAKMEVPNILGTTTKMSTAGTLEFEMEGKEYRLIAMGDPVDPELFILFGDETNGSETYHGGRFLTATLEDDGKTAIIDFNKAYNPPCVFTAYATCPLPPQMNRLTLRVEAGEKMYGEHH